MYKAAQTELAVLKLLAQSDPDNRKHCIRLLRHFEYRHHMCFVFEPMVRACACTRRGCTSVTGKGRGGAAGGRVFGGGEGGRRVRGRGRSGRGGEAWRGPPCA